MRAPLVVAVGWVVVGLAVGLQRPVPTGGGPLLVAVALGAALVALSAPRSPSGRLLWLLFAGAGLVLGVSVRTQADRSCARWIPDDVPLEVRGTVLRSSPGSGGVVRVRLRTDSVRLGAGGVGCRAELPARLERSEPPQPGAMVRGRGRWWTPPGARSVLARPGALLLDTVWAEPGAAVGRRSWAGALRQAVGTRIDTVFPRHPALVSSLLLARRDRLDPDVRDRYARAGLSHLLAISGLHVGLVAGILLLLTGALRVRKARAAPVAAAGTVAYVALLGAPHSAARAALQIVLVLVARGLQRPTRTEAVIAAAALVLLAADPGAVARPGFQLSFAGVAGIVALRRPFLERLGGLTRARLPLLGRGAGRWLADGLATSLAATLATAPIVAWHFGRVAPIGIAANVVAIPLLGAAVPALALALAAGSVWVPAGRFVAGGAELLLDALDAVAGAAAAVPMGTIAVPSHTALTMTVAVALGYRLSVRLGRVRGAVRSLAWAATAGAVVLVSAVRPGADRVEVHLIDVGQGDAIALRSPGGRWLLVDAGVASRDYDAGARRVVPYLAARGVRRLEALLITHADADHMGGAGAVRDALRPRWLGGPGLIAAKAGYLALLQETRQAGIPWIAVRRGMELDLDGMRVQVLFPDRPGLELADANDGSVVVRVEYGEFAALLTGDAPAVVEEELVRRFGRRLDADVLKVGHHGSSTSTSSALLEASGARTAVISVGRGNRYGHPHRDVLARLQQGELAVYRTDRHGSIVIRAGAQGGVRVLTERPTATRGATTAR